MDDRADQALGAAFAAMLLADSLFSLAVKNGTLSTAEAADLLNALVLKCETASPFVGGGRVWEYAKEQLLRVLDNSGL